MSHFPLSLTTAEREHAAVQLLLEAQHERRQRGGSQAQRTRARRARVLPRHSDAELPTQRLATAQLDVGLRVERDAARGKRV
eukprot:scaffold110573_cov48-Phaeocystis_antarctica.AAC.1